MHDINTISYKGMPLFRTAKVKTPSSLSGSLDGVACFFYVLNGTFTTIEANGSHKISEKEGMLKNNCGHFISKFESSDDGKDYEAVVVFLYPDLFTDIYKNELPSILNQQIAKPPRILVGNQLLEDFVNGMSIYFQNKELIDDELVKLKIKELIMILLKSKHYESVLELFNTLFASGKHEFRTVIENNLFSPINVEELAFLANKSLSTFKREFKQIFDDTPARYIKRRRLERAAELLTSTNDTIYGIAFDCGFQDPTTFSASFQNHFGDSPSNYRLNQIRK